MPIAKPNNAHWPRAVQRAIANKNNGLSVSLLWNTHQNVWNRYMAQLARDAGYEPDSEMIKAENKARKLGQI